MKQPELSLCDAHGKRIEMASLEPFLKTVLPAFCAAADEISLSARFGCGTDECAVTFRCGSDEPVPLSVQDAFHPFVTSSRIRILAGLSVVPQDAQNGIVHVLFGERALVVDVRITVQGGIELVMLRPRWKQ